LCADCHCDDLAKSYTLKIAQVSHALSSSLLFDIRRLFLVDRYTILQYFIRWRPSSMSFFISSLNILILLYLCVFANYQQTSQQTVGLANVASYARIILVCDDNLIFLLRYRNSLVHRMKQFLHEK
jgi:hypothetical protein